MNTKKILLLLGIIIAVGVVYMYMMNTDAPQPATEEVEFAEEAENKDYTGMTVVQAEAKAESEGVLFRAVEIDGQPQPTTRDFREGRINAVVENDVVIDYTVETNKPMVEETENLEPESEPAGNDAIIGMTTAEANAYAEANSVSFRVGMIDGEALPVTMDYQPGRITAEIENDVVVGYSVE